MRRGLTAADFAEIERIKQKLLNVGEDSTIALLYYHDQHDHGYEPHRLLMEGSSTAHPLLQLYGATQDQNMSAEQRLAIEGPKAGPSMYDLLTEALNLEEPASKQGGGHHGHQDDPRKRSQR